MEERPNYYAIIPANVRYADVPAQAKLLYGEITALCNKEGYCWATNKYFASLYGVSEFTVSRWISKLRDKNLIIVDLTPAQKGQEVLRKLSIPIDEKSKGGIDEKSKDNNTYMNNTKNNTKNNKKVLNTSEAQTSHDTEISEIIHMFKEISPSLSYANKTQRTACLDMIDRYGFDKVVDMVRLVLSVQGQRFAPRATTPHAMWQKIGDFRVYFETKSTKNNVAIIE